MVSINLRYLTVIRQSLWTTGINLLEQHQPRSLAYHCYHGDQSPRPSLHQPRCHYHYHTTVIIEISSLDHHCISLDPTTTIILLLSQRLFPQTIIALTQILLPLAYHCYHGDQSPRPSLHQPRSYYHYHTTVIIEISPLDHHCISLDATTTIILLLSQRLVPQTIIALAQILLSLSYLYHRKLIWTSSIYYSLLPMPYLFHCGLFVPCDIISLEGFTATVIPLSLYNISPTGHWHKI